MKQRLEEYIKQEAERGCEHCIHQLKDGKSMCEKLDKCFYIMHDCSICYENPINIQKGCQLIECWKMNDEHFRRICTKLFAIDNASEFFDNHQ